MPTTSRYRWFAPALVAVLVFAPVCILRSALARRQSQTPSSSRISELSPAQSTAIREADLVFIGVIDHLGPPPTYSTGSIIVARQAVAYKITRMLKGSCSLPVLAVNHPVLTTSNRLDERDYHTGASQIIAAWLKPAAPDDDKFRYVLVSDRFTPIPDETAAVSTVIQAIGSR